MANLDSNPKTSKVETSGSLGVTASKPIADIFRQAVERCENAICSILSPSKLRDDVLFFHHIEGMKGTQVTAKFEMSGRKISGEYKGTMSHRGQIFVCIDDQRIPASSIGDMIVGGFPYNMWRGNPKTNTTLLLTNGSSISGQDNGLVSKNGEVFFCIGEQQIHSSNFGGMISADSATMNRYAKTHANISMIHDTEIGVEWQKFLDSPQARAALDYCAQNKTNLTIAGGRGWWYTGGHHQSYIMENAIVATPRGFMLQRFGPWNYGFDQDRPLELQEMTPNQLGKELRGIIGSGSLAQLSAESLFAALTPVEPKSPVIRRRGEALEGV